MSTQFTLEIASHTDPGQVRTQNEDAITHLKALGLAILADGMGGYNAGEVASGMAIALLKSELEQALPNLSAHGGNLHQTLAHAISTANSSIYQMAASRQQYTGMGTTLVVTVLQGHTLTVAHLGDSRLYRMRAGELTQVTQDHSMLQEQINAGVLTAEQARHSLHKNLVTRALGVAEQAQPDIIDHRVEAGDIYLLCSDGLSDMVDDVDIADILASIPAKTLANPRADSASNLQTSAEALVACANKNGGRDNISVILLKVAASQQTENGLVSRFLKWLK